MFNDDLFEEEEFDEDDSPIANVNNEIDETQYVLNLMNKALGLCNEADFLLERIEEINNVLGKENTGIDLSVLKSTFKNILPSIIVDNVSPDLFNTISNNLGSNKLAETYIEEKRLSILENMDKDN